MHQGMAALAVVLQVEEALSDDLTQQTSVYGLQQKLMDLQKEVDTAANKLANTQSRVDLNLKRINELKAEAVSGSW